MTLAQAAKVYKGHDELIKQLRLVWKCFGGPKNQVVVKQVFVDDFKNPTKPKKLSISKARQETLF